MSSDVPRMVLLHGGAHGGWAWERLVPVLAAYGYPVSTPELPMDRSGSTVEDWAAATLAQLPEDGRDLVVVGHSAGGLVLPVLATRAPVRRMVFVCAVVPQPGRTHAAAIGTPRPVTIPPERLDHDAEGRMVVSWAAAREFYYADCPEDLARAAWRRLVPFALTVWAQTCPLTDWPDVASTVLYGADDRSLDGAYVRRSAQRLGVDAVALPTGHSPMLAAPDRLAAELDAAVSGRSRSR